MPPWVDSSWGQLGFAGVALFCVWAVIRGWLVPISTLNTIKEIHTTQLEDLKAAVALREESNRLLLDQQHRLLELALPTNHMVVRREVDSDATP